MSLPPIRGYISNSLIEWEGQIASLVFLSGCNFRCPMCHSPDLVLGENLETIPWSVVRQSLESNLGWVDGLVISGGEPTIQPGLKELIVEAREAGVKTKLDTNGSRPGVLGELLDLGLLDAVSMDVKAPLDERYYRVSGTQCDLAALKESIRLLLDSGIDYEFRTTVCPRFLGEKEVVAIAQELRGARRYVLQPFRATRCLDPSLCETRETTREELVPLAERASRYVMCCYVRGEQEPARRS